MNRNRFNVNNRSAELAQARVATQPVRSTNVSLGNGFGASQQDTLAPKILTTYLGL
jgi:hypothetical protein